MDKLIINYPVIVEGKYDKIKLDSIIEADIITTSGFGLFNSPIMQDYIRALSQKTKIIVLTDSDGAGLVIRNKIKSIVENDRIINLYTPDIYGKEKRKKAPSKSGILGVEGVSAELLRKLFAPFSSDKSEGKEELKKLTKTQLYIDGFFGVDNSREKRNKLMKILKLPPTLSCDGMLEAINLLYGYEKYKEIIDNEF